MLDNEQKLPLIPALPSLSGEYTHATRGAGWSYTYDIHAAATRSERRIGVLRADGLERELIAARPGDTVPTPWGLMQRVKDGRYERGFLLEHTHGKAIDPEHGQMLDVPEEMLARDGQWTGRVGPWRYQVDARAMKSRSERRAGQLFYGPRGITASKEGDYVDGPWGRLRWMGPVNADALTDYEQGFLLYGTYDRPLDDMEGKPIFPGASPVAVRLESLYLYHGFGNGEGRDVHAVSLLLDGRPDGADELTGTLLLDPNACTLNEFGDRQGCTKIAVRAVDVTLGRMRLADPSRLKRRLFEVRGDGLDKGLALVVQGRMSRCYLKLDRQLVPLYLDDGV